MKADAELRLASHVLIENDGSEAGGVIIDGRTGAIYACNATAYSMAESLVVGADLETLAKSLTDNFDISKEQALRDAGRFVDGLGATNLLAPSGARDDMTMSGVTFGP